MKYAEIVNSFKANVEQAEQKINRIKEEIGVLKTDLIGLEKIIEKRKEFIEDVEKIE